MAHAKKMTRAAVGHMFKHYERGKDETGEYVKFKNEAIDLSKSHLNYNLGPERDISQGEFIRQRCSEIHCLNRKDVNVACSWVVTLPKDFHETNDNREEREFFGGTYDFLEKRYGKENIVSSYVHMDETQSHMHFCFVPVKYDEKKQYYKLSAKDVVSRYDLQTFHEDLREHLLNERDLYCNVLNGATRDGNKSIEELKRGTAIMELQNARKTILEEVEIQKDVLDDLTANLGQITSNMTDTEHKLSEELKKLEEIKKIRGSVHEGVKENKDFRGNVKSVTMPLETYEACVSAHTRVDHAELKTKNAEVKLEKIKKSASFEENFRLAGEVRKANGIIKTLEDSIVDLGKQIDKINKIFSRFPEIADACTKAWKVIVNERKLEKEHKNRADSGDRER